MYIIWKVVLGEVNFQIRVAVKFHFDLHGFLVEQGMSTASLESKLLQKLMAMRKDVLYELFLNLQKAYNNLDRDLYLDVLVGYRIRISY